MSTAALPPDDHQYPAPHRRRNWKRFSVIGASFLAALVAGTFLALVLLLNNASFRQYLLRIAHQRVSEAVGAEVRMRDFSVHLSWLTPSVDMYDVVVDGAAPYQNPPLLRIDRLSAGFRITSFLNRKWHLNEVVIDHPVAHIFVDENGETNLPKSKTTGQGETSIFDLGIRHVMLGQGELYYNDRKSTVEADLRHLEFQSRFETGAKRYTGGLRYQNGVIRMEDLNAVTHSMEAEFDATPAAFKLTRAAVTTGASRLTLAATVTDYANPRINATYQASLDSGELRQILDEATLPIGIVQVAGSAQYESQKDRPLLDMLRLEGNLASGGLQIRTTTLQTHVRNLSARYILAEGDLKVTVLTAGILGGGLSGYLTVHDIADAQVSELHAALNKARLADIQNLAARHELRRLKVAGTADARIDANWRKSFSTLVAHADARIQGAISPNDSNSTANVPLNGEIHAQYSALAGEVSFKQSYLRMPQTSLALDGTVSDLASLNVQFRSNDLHELETFA